MVELRKEKKLATREAVIFGPYYLAKSGNYIVCSEYFRQKLAKVKDVIKNLFVFGSLYKVLKMILRFSKFYVFCSFGLGRSKF